MGRHVKNLSGLKFNKLTVLIEIKRERNRVYWECLCDCGNVKFIDSGSLQNGHTKSCGCGIFNNEFDTVTKSGLERIKNIWFLMKGRCLNLNNPCYDEYGGRGITICEEWVNSFDSFYNWSMSNNYSDTLTIDRINNDGNYEPGNCKWATGIEQANNKRNNTKVEYKGQIVRLYELCNNDHKRVIKVAQRISRGWDVERALLTE